MGRLQLVYAHSENLFTNGSEEDLRCESAMDVTDGRNAVRTYMNEVRGIGGQLNNVELAEPIVPGQPTSIAARDRIALSHLRLVTTRAFRIARRMGNFQLTPDLIGAGNLGLIQAARKAEESDLVDPGAGFENYATPFIQREMEAVIRNQYIFRKVPNSNGKRVVGLRMLLIIDNFPNDTQNIGNLSTSHGAGNSDPNSPEIYVQEELLGIISANLDAFLDTLSARQREIFQLRFNSSDEDALSLLNIGRSLTIPVSEFTVGKEVKTLESKLREFFIPLFEGMTTQEPAQSTTPPAMPTYRRLKISDSALVHDILTNSYVSGIVNNLIPSFLSRLNNTAERRVFQARTSTPPLTFAQLSTELQRTSHQLETIEARVFRSFVIFLVPHLSGHRGEVGDHFFRAAEEFQRRIEVAERINNAVTPATYLESLLQRPELLEIVMAKFTTFSEDNLKDDMQRMIFSNRFQSEPLTPGAIARQLGVSREVVAGREDRMIRRFFRFMRPFWPNGFVPEI